MMHEESVRLLYEALKALRSYHSPPKLMSEIQQFLERAGALEQAQVKAGAVKPKA